MTSRNLTTKYGNPNPEQVVQFTPEGRTFYSYGHAIASYDLENNLTVSAYWNASSTTNYYRIQFTGLNTAATRKGLADGTIKYDANMR